MFRHVAMERRLFCTGKNRFFMCRCASVAKGFAAMTAPRTLMVMAGGTGGHVYPALAVAEELRTRGWKVFWLGTKTGLEARIVPKTGIDMVWVSMAGLRGNGMLRWALLPFTLLLAFWQSVRAILQRRPDVVLGMGGYTAFPGGMMASLLHRPVVIHEQNSVAGLTNRVLACLAERVLIAFPQAFHGKKDHPDPMPRCGERMGRQSRARHYHATCP